MSDEGRISTVDGSTQYYYDAEGRRFATGTVGQAPSTDFLYDLNGSLVTLVGSNFKLLRTSLYAAGVHWADYTAGTGSGGGATVYRRTDEVGTMIFDEDENGNVVTSCDSGPFGETLQCNPSIDYTESHFADQKRDQESRLDYMGARYYSSTLGRWLSPDPSPAGIDIGNPQSWNLYNYSLNNPLRFIDRNGMWATSVHAQIVTYALQDYASAGELDELRARQYAMDADQSDQNPHAMANNNGQSSQDALGEMWKYVAGQMDSVSQNISGGALSGAGLEALGNAIHTL